MKRSRHAVPFDPVVPPDATGRIYDRLVAEFGKAHVFKDVDSIPLGQDFRGHPASCRSAWLLRKSAVIGGGKTTMDTVGWLLGHGVPADSVTWVVPRDSWLVNHATIQPGQPGSTVLLDSMASRLEASADARTVDELYDRLERG